jgi:hypothetical protein
MDELVSTGRGETPPGPARNPRAECGGVASMPLDEEEEKRVRSRGEDFVPSSMLESPLTPLDEIMPPPNGVGALLFRFDIDASSSIM